MAGQHHPFSRTCIDFRHMYTKSRLSKLRYRRMCPFLAGLLPTEGPHHERLLLISALPLLSHHALGCFDQTTISDYPKLSLTRPPGLLLWKTIRVLWQYRCDVRFRGSLPDISTFLSVLHSEVAKWLEMLELS